MGASLAEAGDGREGLQGRGGVEEGAATRRGKEAKQEIDIAYENELPLCRRMFHGNLPRASLSFLYFLRSFSIPPPTTDPPGPL